MKQLLKFVTKAEKAGFSSTIASDHVHPWWHDNAFGNFTWVWIAAAAERTKKMQFITGVTAPIYRPSRYNCPGIRFIGYKARDC